MAKVKSRDLDRELYPYQKRFHTVYTIDIKVPLKHNTRETKYFIFFLPYYKSIETDVVIWTINIEAWHQSSSGSYKLTGDVHLINLSGLDFLHSIIGGDLGGCGLSPDSHITKEDIKKSTRLCGLVAVTYVSDEDGNLINLDGELLPAFKEYTINRFTGQSFVMDIGRKDELCFLPFAKYEYPLKKYIKVLHRGG